MSAHENLTRLIQASDALKPWIMLGPFNHDLSSQVRSSACRISRTRLRQWAARR